MMQDKSQTLNALLSLCRTINDGSDLNQVFHAITDTITSQLHVHAVAVLMYNPQIKKFEYTLGQGFHTKNIEFTSLNRDALFSEGIVQERQIIHIPNLKQEKISERTQLIEREEFISYYGLPLSAKGQILGLLEVFHRDSLVMDPESIIFLKVLAEQLTLAISSSYLLHHLQQSNQELTLAYQTTIEGWVRALDVRDRETEGHSQRVTELTLRLAREMDIGNEQLVHIARGALLHDIGKLGIRDAIL
jgi:HD-GYP domain-containing protein (c-di-GMP phosphodiesterase class II)